MATLTRNPTSDVTASGTWSGTAGSRYTLVNDYPSTDTSNQLTHGTSAGAILFGYDAISLDADNAISAVRIYYYDRELTTGNNNIGARLRIGGVDYDAREIGKANCVIAIRSLVIPGNNKSVA